MQNDKICSEIVTAYARTRVEANILLNEVDVLLRSIYKTAPPDDFESVLSKDVRAKIAYMITNAVKNSNAEEFLLNIKNKITSLNYVSLTVAFEPNLEIINRLNVWVKQNVGQNCAIDINIDKRIIGGAVIEYEGKIVSLTLHSKIDEYFLTNNVNI